MEAEILVPEMIEDSPLAGSETIVGKTETSTMVSDDTGVVMLESAPGSSTETRIVPVMQLRNPAQTHPRQVSTGESPDQKRIRLTTEARMDVEDRMPASSRPLDLGDDMEMVGDDKRPRMSAVRSCKAQPSCAGNTILLRGILSTSELAMTSRTRLPRLA